MSFEYEIRPGRDVDADDVLRRLDSFTRYDEACRAYEYGHAPIPDAHAHINHDRITFCVNTNAGTAVLDALLSLLRDRGAAPEVREL